jgi:hypothetical protein
MLIYSSINYYTFTHYYNSIDLFHLTCQYNDVIGQIQIVCWTIEERCAFCVYLPNQSPKCVLVPGYRAK